MKEGKQV